MKDVLGLSYVWIGLKMAMDKFVFGLRMMDWNRVVCEMDLGPVVMDSGQNNCNGRFDWILNAMELKK